LLVGIVGDGASDGGIDEISIPVLDEGQGGEVEA
jgi:hypothetical protein